MGERWQDEHKAEMRRLREHARLIRNLERAMACRSLIGWLLFGRHRIRDGKCLHCGVTADEYMRRVAGPLAALNRVAPAPSLNGGV